MKVQLFAYLTDLDLKLVKLQDLADVSKITPHLHYCNYDPTTFGHVIVGTAEIDVELLPPDQIVGNAVLALRAQAAEIRAKATREVMELEGKVQQLLAIENGVAA
jgi:hypothetical protein